MLKENLNVQYQIDCFSTPIGYIAVWINYPSVPLLEVFYQIFHLDGFLGELFLLLESPNTFCKTGLLSRFPLKFHVHVFCELCFTLSLFHQYTFVA